MTRDLRDRPSPLQNLVEILVQGLDDFVVSIGGTGSRKYLPLFGSLFLFIVFSNWLSVLPFIGQVKFLHSPTADYHINFGMALVAWVARPTVVPTIRRSIAAARETWTRAMSGGVRKRGARTANAGASILHAYFVLFRPKLVRAFDVEES